jgi:hypothetical protein
MPHSHEYVVRKERLLKGMGRPSPHRQARIQGSVDISSGRHMDNVYLSSALEVLGDGQINERIANHATGGSTRIAAADHSGLNPSRNEKRQRKKQWQSGPVRGPRVHRLCSVAREDDSGEPPEEEAIKRWGEYRHITPTRTST